MSSSLIDQGGFETPEFADVSSQIRVFELGGCDLRWLRNPRICRRLEPNPGFRARWLRSEVAANPPNLQTSHAESVFSSLVVPILSGFGTPEFADVPRGISVFELGGSDLQWLRNPRICRRPTRNQCFRSLVVAKKVSCNPLQAVDLVSKFKD